MGLTIMAYLLSFFAWAILYYMVPEQCQLDIVTFQDAWNLSVQTLMTIGYGVSDPHFQNCTMVTTLVTLQSIYHVLLDALCFGLVFTRLSRGGMRGKNIIFSRAAVINRPDPETSPDVGRQSGKKTHMRLMIQLVEQSSNALAEAHVRLYVVRRVFRWSSSSARTPEACYNFQVFPLRLQVPSDEQGSMLLTVLPSTVQHGIDESSPLMPTDRELSYYHSLENPGTREEHEDEHEQQDEGTYRDRPRPRARPLTPDDSSESASTRDSKDPPTHFVSSHPHVRRASMEAVRQHLRWSHAEIVMVVEGVDINTSHTAQARQSYTLRDVEFNSAFAPCVFPGPDGRGARVDMRRFHALGRHAPISRAGALVAAFACCQHSHYSRCNGTTRNGRSRN
eukprot:g45668.t1